MRGKNNLVRTAAVGGAIMLIVQFAVAQQMPQTTKKEIAGASTVTTDQISGTVIVVDGNKLVVRMSTGDIRYFEPPESRKFMIDGQEVTLQQLRPGTKLQATITTTNTPVTERTTTIGSGKVWFVSGNTLIVTLPNNENRSFKVDDSYRFIVGGHPASVHELRKGMVISAQKIVEQPRSVLSSNVAVSGHALPAPQPREVAQTRTMPAPQPTEVAQTRTATEPPAVAPAPVAKSEKPARLPNTGSPLPLFGVVGLLFVGASFGIRAFRR